MTETLCSRGAGRRKETLEIKQHGKRAQFGGWLPAISTDTNRGQNVRQEQRPREAG